MTIIYMSDGNRIVTKAELGQLSAGIHAQKEIGKMSIVIESQNGTDELFIDQIVRLRSVPEQQKPEEAADGTEDQTPEDGKE